MQVKLRVVRGGSAGKEIGIKVPKFLIGRSEECQMRARSDAISRRHCVIFMRSTGIAVRDLGSRNGTYVNGVKIEGDQPLKDGDNLQVGPLEFIVVIQATAQTKAAISSTGGAPERVGDLVNAWLEELDEPEPADPQAMAQRDTGRFYTDDTEAVVVDPTSNISTNAHGATQPLPQSEQTHGKEGAKPEGKNEGKNEGKTEATDASATKAVPGKLPKRVDGPDKPKNTQEAAAQMLKKMWNRR